MLRVHYAVLKIRTALGAVIPASAVTRCLAVPRLRQSPAPSGPNSVLIQPPATGGPFPPAAEAEGRTSRRLQAASWMNNQCSTRLHGRRGSRSLPDDARCSLERR
jgi:hypothetical protein